MAMDELITVDLSNYHDRQGSHVPEGRYKVRVIDVDVTNSANNNPMINVGFEIIEGEYQGMTLVDRYVQTDKVLFRTVGFLQAIGLNTPRKRLGLKSSMLMNRVLFVDVEDGEPYMGRVRSEVRGWGRASNSDASDVLEGDFEEVEEDPWAGTTPPENTAPPGDDLLSTPATAEDDDEIDLDKIDLN